MYFITGVTSLFLAGVHQLRMYESFNALDVWNLDKFAVLGGSVIEMRALALLPLFQTSLKIVGPTDFDYTKTSLVAKDVYEATLHISWCQWLGDQLLQVLDNINIAYSGWFVRQEPW